MQYLADYDSPLGRLTLASDGTSITGLWIEGQKYHGTDGHRSPERGENPPVLAAATQWLDRYFAGERPAISELSLAPAGSPFRQDVWKLLREIPYGEVTTYGELARQMAKSLGKKKMASQAVGGAVGHNPISIIVPCHRVVGSNGSLTGYAGGIDIKVRLLEYEGVDMTPLYVPTKGTAL
jgi:methylated-DNA-[protein]-cysteine S-methyltransferase